MKERMNVIAAQKNKDGKTFWNKVGAAWSREDGGWSVSLFAMPAPSEGEYRFLIVPIDGERKAPPKELDDHIPF